MKLRYIIKNTKLIKFLQIREEKSEKKDEEEKQIKE